MALPLSKMTPEQLTNLIDARIERKLEEILGDPDRDLEIRDEVRQQLLEQRSRVAEGERGRDLDEVIAELGLD